ncbi:MAG: sigma-70 family RNA polymerase sigma factor [Verrucomicrobia bacterium]|nr:sigma-70 family RNA polymerase sigma factor [Verrucomicrobiota bacterium]
MNGDDRGPTNATAGLAADVAAWCRGRDESAARRLIAALYPQVIAIIRRRLPRRVAEEDLAQEVFARLFERLGDYDGRAPLTHWVARMTLNICIDHLRAEKRRPELRWADLTETEADALTATLAGPDRPAADALGASQLAAKLLGMLGPEDRLVVTMLDLEGRSVAEVREATGWREGAIRIRAFRARRKLRKELLKLEKRR